MQDLLKAIEDLKQAADFAAAAPEIYDKTMAYIFEVVHSEKIAHVVFSILLVVLIAFDVFIIIKLNDIDRAQRPKNFW